MRRLLITAACLLLTAGAAAAQTRGLAPYASQAGDPAQVQTGRRATTPGPAVQPGAETARLGPYRGHRPTRHRMMRHRRHGAHACMRRAAARGLHGHRATRYIQHCEVRHR